MSMVLELALSFFFIIRIFHTRKKTSDLDTALVSVEIWFIGMRLVHSHVQLHLQYILVRFVKILIQLIPNSICLILL